MGRRAIVEEPQEIHKSKPAHTQENRETRMVSKAWDLLEQRLADGTASPSEVTMVAKWGSKQSRLEQELAETKMELMKAKQAALESSMRMEEMFEDAMRQFRRYNGVFEEEVDEDLR